MAKEWKERIKIDAAIQGGKPVIKGRRVPIEVVVGALAGGDSIEQVCEDYLLSREDVFGGSCICCRHAEARAHLCAS